jgi:membrane-bound lytic murein transglycosylase MltF
LPLPYSKLPPQYRRQRRGPPLRPSANSVSPAQWQGDFDAMLARHELRVLVPYSRTLYFNDRGREGGLTVELVRDFERYVNTTYADRLGNRPLTVYVIPTTRNRLLPNLNAGLGDIARMRKEAAQRGLDPDKWFNNVEIVVAEKIGMETTIYVRNIYKYYVSYRLMAEAESERAGVELEVR